MKSYSIKPADRLESVSEYYFSRKLKEVAQMNAEGKNVISLGIGSPDMPPSEATIKALCENAMLPDVHGYQPTTGTPELRKAFAEWYKKWYDVELNHRNTTAYRVKGRNPARDACICKCRRRSTCSQPGLSYLHFFKQITGCRDYQL